MERTKLFSLVWSIATVTVLNVSPARADVVTASAEQFEPEVKNAESIDTTGMVVRRSDVPRSYNNVKDWLAQEVQQNRVIQVTGVRLSPTASGLEAILETPTPEKLQSTTKREGNTFIVDIANTQLRLPLGNSFRSNNPVSGITTVTVTNQGKNSIRVTMTGETSVPKVELFNSAEGLIFGITTTVSSTQQQQRSQKPPTVEPPSETSTQPSVEQEEEVEIVVTGEQEEGYRVEESTTGTKLPVPHRDLPLSIQVVPQQVLEDRGVVDLDEFTDNVSGVQRARGFGEATGFTIRGFTQSYAILRNGFPILNFISPVGFGNTERIEVLKGPASVLYGGGSQLNISGVVNTITKKPESEPFYKLDYTRGSFEFNRATLDATGPLTSDNSLLYRLNVAYEDSDSFRNFDERSQNFLIAPALTWRIGPRTTLAAEFEYLDYSYPFESGFPLEPEVLELPLKRILGESGLDATTGNFTSFSYDFDHQFSDSWRFRQGFNVAIANIDIGPTRFYGTLLDDRRTLERTARRGDQRNENVTLQNELLGKFNTGSLRHNVLFGVELSRRSYPYKNYVAPLAPIDIFAPTYGALPGEFSLEYADDDRAETLGIYIQDFVEVLPNLKVLAGLRFDSIDQTSENPITSEVGAELSSTDVSPRIGIVYQPASATSLYFNWSQSIYPQFLGYRSQTGELFEPERGEQFEFGIKQNFLDNRLSATLAFYQIDRQSVATPDLTNINDLFYVITGEQRSRGIELDIAGEPLSSRA
ncbi:MAG: Vitamin B12 transporter BtuB [Chroococcidiopsis sp. SAG 2025]|uniref:TonB-dependent siderophore receptor n=1 Tax=Chroococcidiopsis sp. SAG 2025 TaxID=171389 RepID=UPI0029371521|nr:TonB-dependent siderophore receptor [Chroococcidiopsis sp. SAG 2025]MDV2994824.1 Vitamin B12 transporter BtuB [Chroococcidiopsis sp. SAG 2025]